MFKKGSISLSINMIVVVVLAFVMLGLMLGLGQRIIDGASETASQVSEQTRQDIVNRLTQSNEPLYFNQREFEVPFGNRRTITFGVRNVDPVLKNLAVAIRYMDPSDPGAGALLNASRSADISTGGSFFWSPFPQRFGPGESTVFDVQYYAPRGERNTYIFKFQVVAYDEDGTLEGVVAEQLIFINVI